MGMVDGLVSQIRNSIRRQPHTLQFLHAQQNRMHRYFSTPLQCDKIKNTLLFCPKLRLAVSKRINRLQLPFEKLMPEEYKKDRCRLGSDNITADEVLTKSELASVEFKPTQDPDMPPEFSLQLEESEEKEHSMPLMEAYQMQDLSPVRRGRTHSEDFQYTILGFLETKIRERKISEQLESLLVLDESGH